MLKNYIFLTYHREDTNCESSIENSIYYSIFGILIVEDIFSYTNKYANNAFYFSQSLQRVVFSPTLALNLKNFIK